MSIFIYVIGALVALYAVKLLLISVFFYKEVKGAMERDPAAKDFLEVFLLYQGLHAIVF